MEVVLKIEREKIMKFRRIKFAFKQIEFTRLGWIVWIHFAFKLV
jgi:hypothetical protein